MWKSIINKIDRTVSLTAYTFVCTLFCLIFVPTSFFIIAYLLLPESFKPLIQSIGTYLFILTPAFGIALGYKVRQFDKKREENKKLMEFLKENQYPLEDNVSKKVLRSLR